MEVFPEPFQQVRFQGGGENITVVVPDDKKINQLIRSEKQRVRRNEPISNLNVQII